MDYAFYRIDPAALPTEEEGRRRPVSAYGCHLLRETSSYLWVISATDPNEALEDLGAERLAGDWGEFYRRASSLSTSTRDHVFQVLVEVQDEETGEFVRRRVSRIHAEKALGLSKKAEVVTGGNAAAGKVDPPTLPNEDTEGIISTEMVPVVFAGEDADEEQARLDRAVEG